MRGWVAAALVVLTLPVAVPQAAGSGRPLAHGPSMTVTAAPRAARAHPVRLEVTLRYEMQCGYPGRGPLVVTFPAAVKLPRQFAAGAVKLAGKPIVAKIDGRRVTVTVPRHKGMLCDLIGPGSVTLAFTRAARLPNPRRPGSYSFEATHAKRAFAAKLAVKPAS